VRQEVADFLQRRDGGVVASADQIYLTAGASEGIALLLGGLIANSSVGVRVQQEPRRPSE
jgi:aspartate/methionine/tyrosine aminotransferase